MQLEVTINQLEEHSALPLSRLYESMVRARVFALTQLLKKIDPDKTLEIARIQRMIAENESFLDLKEQVKQEITVEDAKDEFGEPRSFSDPRVSERVS